MTAHAECVGQMDYKAGLGPERKFVYASAQLDSAQLDDQSPATRWASAARRPEDAQPGAAWPGHAQAPSLPCRMAAVGRHVDCRLPGGDHSGPRLCLEHRLHGSWQLQRCLPVHGHGHLRGASTAPTQAPV